MYDRQPGPVRVEKRPPLQRQETYGLEEGAPPERLDPGQRLLALQGRVGNRRVQQLVSASRQRSAAVLQKDPAPNLTGLPDRLKAGVEALSGLSLDEVRVHFNSSKPAELQALAYTQGTDIHVAPGQEHHLPHEAWHVVQQAQGRVKPSFELKGGSINNDEVLEAEADTMGAKAGQKSASGLPVAAWRSGDMDTPLHSPPLQIPSTGAPGSAPIQRVIDYATAEFGKIYLVNGVQRKLVGKNNGYLYFEGLDKGVRASEVDEVEMEESDLESQIGSQSEEEYEGILSNLPPRAGKGRQEYRAEQAAKLSHIHSQKALGMAMTLAMGGSSASQGTSALMRTESGTEYPASISSSKPLAAFFKGHTDQPMAVAPRGESIHAEMLSLAKVIGKGSLPKYIWVSKGICPICTAVLKAFGVGYGPNATREGYAPYWTNPFDKDTDSDNWKTAADAAREANQEKLTTLYNV